MHRPSCEQSAPDWKYAPARRLPTRSIAASGASSITLDSIVDENEARPVALLKVDTDGYDGDVIMSGVELLKTSQPILSWENYAGTPDEVERLSEFYSRVSELGYKHAWVFDNFGNVMLADCDLRHVESLNRYVAAQSFHRCTRTIDYADILATTVLRYDVAKAAVDRYKTDCIFSTSKPIRGIRGTLQKLRRQLRHLFA